MEHQEIFQNAQVDLSTIPSADQLEWKRLQPSYKRLQLLSTLLWCAAFIGTITIAIPVVPVPFWVPVLAYTFVIVFTILQLIGIYKGFVFKGYALRMHDILYKSGWLYKKQIAIPFNRIQHVDIRQGLFERAFGLSKLNVYTAGGQGSDITIPGLLDDDARKLKEYILRETTDSDTRTPEASTTNEEE